MRNNWRWLLAFYASLALPSAAPALFSDSSFVQGLTLGISLAGSAGALVTLIVIQTGTGPTMAGELAEQWTAQALRPLHSRGYKLVNHVIVDGRGDADHLLVGPGGVFLLETKWSAAVWMPEESYLLSAVDATAKRAHRAWQQLKTCGAPDVTPVVVLWGRAQDDVAARTGVRQRNGVYVIAGHSLQTWLSGRPGDKLDSTEVDAVYSKISTWAARTDEVDTPVPRSVEELCWLGLGFSAIAAGTLIALLQGIRLGFITYLLLSVLAIFCGFGLRKLRGWVGLAVVVGSGASVAVGLAALLLAYS